MPWLANSILLIESFLAGVKTGSVAISPVTNLFGYKPDSDAWQLIAIQMFNFASGMSPLDAFRISIAGSWPNNIDLGLDDIRYQHGNIAPANEVIPQGVYGSGTKHLQVTVDKAGTISKIEEINQEEATGSAGAPVSVQLIGDVDGINKVFSTPDPYLPNSISVFVNGIKEQFSELTNNQIFLNSAPKNTGFTDLVEAMYVKLNS